MVANSQEKKTSEMTGPTVNAIEPIVHRWPSYMAFRCIVCASNRDLQLEACQPYTQIQIMSNTPCPFSISYTIIVISTAIFLSAGTVAKTVSGTQLYSPTTNSDKAWTDRASRRIKVQKKDSK